MENVMEKLVDFATVYGIKIIGAILILVIGRIVAGIVRKVVKKLLTKTKTDVTIVKFVATLAYMLIMVFTVLAALSKFGIETASFIAVLAAAGFAIGFALQGSLSNFAAGIMVLVFRPFRVGDVIDAAGVLGVVKEIRLFNTIVATPDNIKVIVPNGKIYGDVIKNITGYDTRRVDMSFGIGYSSSIQKSYDIITGILKEDQRILQDPAPQIAVAELADSSVNFVVRPWVKKDDYWGVKFDVTEKVKKAFDEAGIEIPFPQRSVHMVSETTN
jgi:small conductance mechanosensitive channel